VLNPARLNAQVPHAFFFMKILFVSLSLPFPPIRGQRLRNYSLLRALARDGHQVSLISFGDTREAALAERGLSDACALLDVVAEPGLGGLRQYSGRLQALWVGVPYGALRIHSVAMMEAVRKRLAAECFDFIVCDDVYQMVNMPTPCPLPLVLNKHDITYEIVQRFLEYERNPLKLAYGRAEYRSLKRFENQACAKAAAVWPCSERDRGLLAPHSPRTNFAVVPNVVDVDDYTPASDDDGRTVLFVGAMDWLPNRDAVEFFVTQVMPELQGALPDVRFVVAGREPPAAFRRRFEGAPSVTFTGSVPDMRPLIAQAAVCTVPLRIGSGTRLKIIEAAAMAKAVVSTTVGAEGLTLRDGKEIVIADRPKHFAQEIATMLGDRQRRLKIGKAARELVSSQYGISALRDSLREALKFVNDQCNPVCRAAG
jgi:polysaccharide biosynthesis protein PslH